MTDARGNQADFAYDPSTGLITSATSPAPSNGAVRPQTRYGYSLVSGVSMLTGVSQCQTQASCAGTADEVKIAIGYNANLLPTSVTKGAGDGSLSVATKFGYDAVGNKTSATNPNGFTTTMNYDADRRQTMRVGPDPDGSGPLKNPAVQVHYAPGGQIDQQSTGTANADGSGFTAVTVQTASYDATNRKVTSDVRDGSGTVYSLTQYNYDALGRPDCTALRMNPGAYGSLPGACDLGTQGSFGPDRIGRAEYDALGRVTKVWDGYRSADASATQTSYTVNGQLQSVTDQNNNVTSHAYDGFDRLIVISYPSTSSGAGGSDSNNNEQLGYDANGNRTSWRKRDGRVFGFNFDALNRMTAKLVPTACVSGYACTPVPGWATRAVYYSYDLLGRQTGAYFDGLGGDDQVTSGYDGLGRLTRTTTVMSGVSRTLSYDYDADGNRTRIVHPDGASWLFSYDGLDRFTAIGDGGWNWLAAVGYDNAGRRSWLARPEGVNTGYGYDGASRLIWQVQDHTQHEGDSLTEQLSYNPAGQIVSRSRSNGIYAFTSAVNVNRGYQVNGLNQYTSAGPASFGYDANGNLTSDGTTSYTYDAENRLVGSSAGSGLAYDPLGRLWKIWGAQGETQFLYDGDRLAAEYDQSGNLLRRYVHGPGEDEPLIWYDGAGFGDRRGLQADPQGSVISVSDASGNLKAINAYDEYGIPNKSNVGRYQYTGQAWIPELGMYHYKARMYSPTLGRFLQVDPIGYADGLNWHAYVHNDPVNGTDSAGTQDGGPNYGPGAMIPTTGSDIVVFAPTGPSVFATFSPGGPVPPSIGQLNIVQVSRVAPQNGTWNARTAWRRAHIIAEEEINRTRKLAGPHGGHNDVYDAERHARWTYRMTMEIGAFWADLFSGMREDVEELPPEIQPSREYSMDNHNNLLGINAALNGRPIPDIHTPGLIYIRPKGGYYAQ